MNVAIIGAGPAGISAAIQLKKEGIRFELFEKSHVGGMLWYASRVDNLLGHRGKSGRVLCNAFSEHLDSLGISVTRMEISVVRSDDEGFVVGGNRFTHLIMATGTYPKRLGKPGEIHFIEDPEEFDGQDILVVGGGDLAFDNALNLSHNNARVTILHRGKAKANNGLVKEVEREGINVISGDPDDIEEDGGRYIFRDNTYQNLLVCIGRSPNLFLIQGIEHLKTHLPSFRTSVKGLYVIGDAALGTLSQTALASGSGLAAAMDIAKTVKKDETAL